MNNRYYKFSNTVYGSGLFGTQQYHQMKRDSQIVLFNLWPQAMVTWQDTPLTWRDVMAYLVHFCIYYSVFSLFHRLFSQIGKQTGFSLT